MSKVAAVIPAHNEAKHIAQIISRTRQYVDYVIVVDDGSTDDTLAIAQQFGGNVLALQQELNLGKGATLKTGCLAASQLKVDIIVCLDADGQHNPDVIPQFVAAITQQTVDVVFGRRKFDSRMPLMMLVGNRVLSTVIKQLFRVLIHDTQSGYRAFTTRAFQKLNWESTGYEAETEMIVHVSERKLSYTEIDIDTVYHDHYKGTTALDGIRILFYILRWKFL